jgi:hypothetical protein
MALPSVHKLNAVHLTANIQDANSATATTSSAYIRVPFRAQFMEASFTTYGATTVANTNLTINVNGVPLTDGSETITVLTAGSAAGNVYTTSVSPLLTAGLDPVIVGKGDIISVTSDHGGTGVCPGTLDIALSAF